MSRKDKIKISVGEAYWVLGMFKKLESICLEINSLPMTLRPEIKGFRDRLRQKIAFPTAGYCATAAEETKEKLIMKIVLTHTEEFPFDCYEGNLANGEYAGAYLVKFKDCAHPELMFVTESQEFEDCCALENGSNIVERDQADEIEAWEPVDACEIASGEHYMPALTRPELLLLKTCLKRGGFNLPLEWRGMAKQLFARFDRDLQGEIQLATDDRKSN